MLVTEMDMPQTLKKTNGATEASLERSAEQLFDDLVSVAFVVDGSDLGTAADYFEPTASCINDKKRQLVTRSGLSSLRCCVCHPTTSGR